MKLPFKDPDYDLNLNMGVVLIIISLLGKTKRNKLTLNNERLHIYLCLIKNPFILNQVIKFSNGKHINLREETLYSITSIAPNFDSLFDNELLKSLLITLISQKLISVNYKKKQGFFYTSTKVGQIITEKFSQEYFADIKQYCIGMNSLQSKNTSQLNIFVNKAIKVK